MQLAKFRCVDFDASKEVLVNVDVSKEPKDSLLEEGATTKKRVTKPWFHAMMWTLLVIFLVSVCIGIGHAAAPARPKSCPAGQSSVRGQCVRTSPVTAVTTPQPRPSPQQALPLQQQPGAACPLGQTMRNGKCSPKQCHPGMAVNVEGKCDCTAGFRKENNRCVSLSAPQTQPCRGQLSKKGNCIPPTQARTKVCPKDHQLRDGKCVSMVTEQVCPSGQRKNRKGDCIPVVVGQSCGKDLWIDAQGQCGSVRPNNGCPVGKERNALGNCVRVQICSQGQVKDASGVCQQTCPVHQFMKDGKCVTADVNSVARG